MFHVEIGDNLLFAFLDEMKAHGRFNDNENDHFHQNKLALAIALVQNPLIFKNWVSVDPFRPWS